MSTLLLAPELLTSNGGIPRILRAYLKALCDLAGEKDLVHFVALNDRGVTSPTLWQYSNYKLGSWSVCHASKLRFIQRTLRYAKDASLLVCGHVAQSPVAWLAQRLRPSLRYVVIAHGIEVWRPFSAVERIALRAAHQIWCVSDFTRREMQKHLALPPERFVVLPNSLDPFFEISPGQPLKSVPPVILTVTRLSSDDRYKGVDQLIAAMPMVRSTLPDARLRIIGQGDDLARLQGLAREAGLLENGVEFLGFVDDVRLREEMASCRLFALPSDREGFGLVFLEAMARGRPCLGTTAGGVPELISADSGKLVPPGDRSALATGCIDGLQREWDEAAILSRARHFSYSSFRERLAPLLVR